jgi:small subunit ribosomal protein S27e
MPVCFSSLYTRRNIMAESSNSKFVKLRCTKCKNEQVVFGKASSKVACLVCGKELAEPTGGKTKVKSRILEVLE